MTRCLSWIVVAVIALSACSIGEARRPSPPASATDTPPAESPARPPTASPSIAPSATPLEQACPDGAVSLGHVVALSRPDRVACFGDAELTLRGWIWDSQLATGCLNDPDARAPAWLTCGLATQLLSPVQLPAGSDLDELLLPADDHLGLLNLHADPDGPVGRIELGQRDGALPVDHWVEVVGHFDDPAAALCADDSVVFDQCRQAFVVTAARVIEFPEIVPPGSFANVVVDELRIRHAPRLTAEPWSAIARGASVYVSDGPRAADGWLWYGVVLTTVGTDDAEHAFGWVASGEADDPYLAVGPVACAEEERYRDLTFLATAIPWERLQCASGQTYVFEGDFCSYFSDPFSGDPCLGQLPCGVIDAPPLIPQWLSFSCHGISATPDGPVLPIHIRSEGLAEDPHFHGMPVRISGHFDDPDAALCEDQTPVSGVSWLWHPPLLREARIIACREAFVVDSMTPVGG